jgi:rhamnose transport system permease protein
VNSAQPSTEAAPSRGPQGAGRPKWFAAYFREISLLATLFVVLGVLALVAPHFFRSQNLLSLAASQAPALVVAIGIAVVMIARQIDISVGSQFAVCAVAAGLFAASGVPLPAVCLLVMLIGALMGAVNGLLVAFLGLPSIVVTLATLVTWAEALRLFQRGKFVNLPPGTQWFGLEQQLGQASVIAAAVLLVSIGAWTLRNLNAGRFVYAVGSDAESARLAGVDPRRTTVWALVH